MKVIKCVKCGKDKPLSAYDIDNPARTKNKCIECYKAYCRAYRKDHYQRTAYRPIKKLDKKMRPCLSCQKEFMSKGIFNRRCKSCKKAQSKQDFYVPVMYEFNI